MSNKTYYAKGNLKHNGTFYKKGDAVELEETTGARLVREKVLQTAPIPEEDLDPVPAATEDAGEDDAEKDASPEAGGTAPTETGEPSIDANANPAPQAQGGILGRMFGGPKEGEIKDPSAGM